MLESFEVGFSGIPALARLPEDERGRFTLDGDGNYLHWDANDIHVGLDMIRFPSSQSSARSKTAE